jgi:hypothetical protein
MRGLPPVPAAGAGTPVGDEVAAHDLPRVVARPKQKESAGATGGTGRRGGHLHGVLVYVACTLMILSSTYGVASSVGDGSNVVTETAASFRSFCDGFLGDDEGDEERSSDRSERGSTATTAAAPEVETLPAPEGSTPPTQEQTQPSAESATQPSSAAPPAQPASASAAGDSAAPSGTWLSGASGDGVADGSFAAWRGTPLGIAGTWVDNNEAMVEVWPLQPGAEFDAWQQSLDIAIGAIDEGESWEEAAQGAYDERWRTSLTNMRDLWGSRPGTLYIRLAHEMNGNWYPWSVDAGNRAAFVTAWMHFRSLQKEIFPAAKLVFSLNRESVGSGFDWRESFPGAQYVDVIGVDYYNQYPYVASAADWTASLDDVDKYGAPKGLQAHLDFARSVGLPLAVPEWSGHAANGDSAAWMQGMHDFFATNAGGGAGQVLYDVQFNIDMHDDSYRVFPATRMPQSAEMYRRLF